LLLHCVSIQINLYTYRGCASMNQLNDHLCTSLTLVYSSDVHALPWSQTPACECRERPSCIAGSININVIKINQQYALRKRHSKCHPPLQGFLAVHAAQRRSQSASDLHALLYQNKQLLCRAAHTAKRYVKQPLIVPHKSALCSLPCRWPLYA